MNIEYKKLNEIRPYENNPRINDEAVEYVANSIKEFGFKVPIVIDKNGVIVAGHTRYKASIELGLKEVPCIVADDLSDEQIKAFRLADNKVSEKAQWDYEALEREMQDILNIDMSLFDFEDLDTDNVELMFNDEEIVEDEAPETPEEPISQLGEIYQLGNHRLMCGDSTNPEDVNKLMDGQLADMVVTDPPYNVAIGIEDIEEAKIRKRRTDGLSIKNDKMDNNDFYMFLNNVFRNLHNALKAGGAFYVWYASREVINFQSALENNDLLVKQELIWNKNAMVMGRQDYQWKHEPCLYGWKEGAGHYFIDDRTQTTVFEDKGIDYKKMKKEELVKLLDDIFSDKVSTTIINENKPSASDLHPTMKPVKLFARQILNSSRPNEKVLDLFGGSGTTIIACEQTKRKAYVMEYDPHYADVIIKRWENFTGEKAVKIN